MNLDDKTCEKKPEINSPKRTLFPDYKKMLDPITYMEFRDSIGNYFTEE